MSIHSPRYSFPAKVAKLFQILNLGIEKKLIHVFALLAEKEQFYYNQLVNICYLSASNENIKSTSITYKIHFIKKVLPTIAAKLFQILNLGVEKKLICVFALLAEKMQFYYNQLVNICYLSASNENIKSILVTYQFIFHDKVSPAIAAKLFQILNLGIEKKLVCVHPSCREDIVFLYSSFKNRLFKYI